MLNFREKSTLCIGNIYNILVLPLICYILLEVKFVVLVKLYFMSELGIFNIENYKLVYKQGIGSLSLLVINEMICGKCKRDCTTTTTKAMEFTNLEVSRGLQQYHSSQKL